MKDSEIKNWLKRPSHLLFVLLIGFVIISKFYYFFLVDEQPIWWDEGDYLAIAKVWVTGMETPEWWSHFTGMRPLFLPLLWFSIFKIGFEEMFIRFFTLLVPSIGTLFVIYLLGKELYNEYVGLIASFMMSCYWVWGFYSYRLLTDIPAVFFGTLCLYFFWHYYAHAKASSLYLSIFFGVLAFATRFPLALVLISCTLFFIVMKRTSLIKDKTAWKAVLFGILCLSPYLIYFIKSKFSALQFYFGSSAVSVHQDIGWHVIPLLFSLPDTIWMVAVLFGICALYPAFLHIDLIVKRKVTIYDSDLFLTIVLLLHLLFYVVIFREATDRWLLMLMPPLFIATGNGLMKLYNFIKNYNSLIALVIILFFLFGGAYQNSVHAHQLIIEKKESYLHVKLAGQWLKDNTLEDAKIITASIVQNQYYSERQSYDFFYNNSKMPKDCIDKFGATIINETCQQASEKLFEEKINSVKPDYFIASLFEPVFTPNWVYSYGERKNLTIMQAYFNSNKQPLLIIYKF